MDLDIVDNLDLVYFFVAIYLLKVSNDVHNEWLKNTFSVLKVSYQNFATSRSNCSKIHYIEVRL